MGESGLKPEGSGTHGVAQEARVRQIAAALGVADFVFVHPQVRKGHGYRELSGDGLLIVGQLGAVLQVKARDPAVADIDKPERATAWTRKSITSAQRQGLGTRREIGRRLGQGEEIKMTPTRVLGHVPETEYRLYELHLDHDVSEWPTIIVIDHPLAPGIRYKVGPDTFVITLKDWYELHRRLRSTHGLIEYVGRVLHDKIEVPLGQEANRYTALYQADLATDDGSEGWITNLPPPDETGSLASDVYRQIIDRVWEHDGPETWADPTQYRQIVEFLDRVPAHVQDEIGSKVLDYGLTVRESGTTRSGGFLLSHKRYLQLVFSSTRQLDIEGHKATTVGLTLARHAALCERHPPQEVKTLGVGILADDDQGVAYWFVFAEGLLAVPRPLRDAVEQRYGPLTSAAG